MPQRALFPPNVRIAVGLVLASLMLTFTFVDGLSRPTNIAWMLLGLSLASGAAGEKLATLQPSIAKHLSTVSFYLIIASIIYTIVLMVQ
jgi:hypothetical protein